MKLAQCPRCSEIVLAGRHEGYPLAVNTGTLSAQTLGRALVDGRQIYRIHRRPQTGSIRLEWVKPGSQPLDPTMVDEHECGSALVYRPLKAPVVLDPHLPPVRPPEAPGEPSRGLDVPAASARSAIQPRSRAHPCDACKEPVALDASDQYVSVELGATVVWALHDVCPNR